MGLRTRDAVFLPSLLGLGAPVHFCDRGTNTKKMNKTVDDDGGNDNDGGDSNGGGENDGGNSDDGGDDDDGDSDGGGDVNGGENDEVAKMTLVVTTMVAKMTLDDDGVDDDGGKNEGGW